MGEIGIVAVVRESIDVARKDVVDVRKNRGRVPRRIRRSNDETF